MLKPLVKKYKYVTFQLPQKINFFQKRRLSRLLKPLVKDWKKRQPHKCLKCKKILNTNVYNRCYGCFMDEKQKCEDCGKLINKDYSKCYGCKYKYNCEKCNAKMLSDKYKACFNCNKQNRYGK